MISTTYLHLFLATYTAFALITFLFSCFVFIKWLFNIGYTSSVSTLSSRNASMYKYFVLFTYSLASFIWISTFVHLMLLVYIFDDDLRQRFNADVGHLLVSTLLLASAYFPSSNVHGQTHLVNQLASQNDNDGKEKCWDQCGLLTLMDHDGNIAQRKRRCICCCACSSLNELIEQKCYCKIPSCCTGEPFKEGTIPESVEDTSHYCCCVRYNKYKLNSNLAFNDNEMHLNRLNYGITNHVHWSKAFSSTMHELSLLLYTSFQQLLFIGSVVFNLENQHIALAVFYIIVATIAGFGLVVDVIRLFLLYCKQTRVLCQIIFLYSLHLIVYFTIIVSVYAFWIVTTYNLIITRESALVNS